MTLLIYGPCRLAVLGAVGPEELAASNTPLLLAAERVLGPAAKYFIVLAATLAITKSLNAILIIFRVICFSDGSQRGTACGAGEGSSPMGHAARGDYRGVRRVCGGPSLCRPIWMFCSWP